MSANKHIANSQKQKEAELKAETSAQMQAEKDKADHNKRESDLTRREEKLAKDQLEHDEKLKKEQEGKDLAEKAAAETKAKEEAEAKERKRFMNQKKNFVLTRKCQVNGVLCNPEGTGALISNLPISQIVPCAECKGTGKDEVCRTCKNEAVPGELFTEGRVVKCPTCNGTAKVPNQDCNYCKGTARSYPPHHYVEVDRDGDVVVEDAEEREEIDDLREQLKELGGDYSLSWKSGRLEQELATLKKTKGVE